MGSASRAGYPSLVAQGLRALTALPTLRRDARFDFGGGWSALDLAQLKADELETAENVHLDFEERLARRGGFSQWGTNALGAPSAVTSLFQYIKADATRFFLASSADGQLWKDAGEGGAWASIATGLATGADVLAQWATFANLAIHVNGSSNVKKFNGTTVADLANVPAAVQGALLAIAYLGRLWLLKGSQANYSDVSDAETWPTNNFLSIDVNNGEDLSGAAVLSSQLYLGKPSRWYAVLGSSPTSFGWFPRAGPGPAARSSMAVADGWAYYQARDGVYKFNGSSPPERVSQKLDPYFDTLNTSRLHLSKGAFDPFRREYWLAVSESGQSAPNRLLVLNIDAQAWFKYLLARNALATILVNEQSQLVAGDASGKVWKHNVGTTDDGAAISYTVDIAPFTFEAPDRSKMLAFVDCWLKDMGAGTMTVAVRIDGGRLTPAGFSVSLDGSATPHIKRATLPEQGRVVQLRLSGSTDMVLVGLEAWGRPIQGQPE